MAFKFSTAQADFSARFAEFLRIREAEEESVSATVSAILREVRARGDAALCEITRRFDRWDATPALLSVSREEVANALALTSPEMMKSLKIAAARIREYSRRQLPPDERYVDEAGITLGWRWTPIDAVGLYVPGGKAAYPSSVLMNAVPALAAGVSRLAMVVPAPGGQVDPGVLAAAHVAGVTEIYKTGGAQGVAALAYGTETVAPVDKIVGPGNAYVAEAKRQVFGRVGIDMIAGPSEILVISDAKSNPAWIAADLMSQAEHDEMAQAVLITDDAAFAGRVEAEVSRLLAELPRANIAAASWEKYGAVIVVRDLSEAAELANALAPEHLELAVEQPDALLPRIRHAGAVFLGRHAPEALGDYVAGPSHVLPTSRTARFASGLSVFDFLKRTSLIGADGAGLGKIGMYGEVMAAQEGLQAHELSLKLRRPPP